MLAEHLKNQNLRSVVLAIATGRIMESIDIQGVGLARTRESDQIEKKNIKYIYFSLFTNEKNIYIIYVY